MENNQEVKKKFKTKDEYVEMLKREFCEIQSIEEGIDEIKDEIKKAGFNTTLLVKLSKAMADNKVDEIIKKNAEFEALVDEVRNS